MSNAGGVWMLLKAFSICLFLAITFKSSDHCLAKVLWTVPDEELHIVSVILHVTLLSQTFWWCQRMIYYSLCLTLLTVWSVHCRWKWNMTWQCSNQQRWLLWFISDWRKYLTHFAVTICLMALIVIWRWLSRMQNHISRTANGGVVAKNTPPRSQNLPPSIATCNVTSTTFIIKYNASGISYQDNCKCWPSTEPSLWWPDGLPEWQMSLQ